MTWLINKLRVPASESNMGIVLAICAVCLGIMSIALVWQAQIIANQRVLIQFLQHELGS
jgi:putative Mn2+ efflux pump MntP